MLIIDDPVAIAHSRAEHWFSIHSEQRMRLFNFYVLLLGGSLALLGNALLNENKILEIMMGMCLILVSAIFKGLDRRTAYLIKSSEKLLDRIEQEVSKEIIGEDVRLIKHADADKLNPTYRQSFILCYLTGGLLGVFSVFHGLA